MRLPGISIAVLGAAVLMGFQSVPASSPSLIAVLENPQCKHPDLLAVRVLFADSDTGWVALTDRDRFDAAGITPRMPWTIAFDGRHRGTVQIAREFPTIEYDWTFPRDMVIALGPNQHPRLVENANEQFGGWCARPKYRPLALVNGSNFQDPEVWKPFTPDASIWDTLFPAFHQVADSVSYCPDNLMKAVPFDYKQSDLLVVRAYRDISGRALIAIRLNPDAYGCDFFGDEDWDVHWFLMGTPPVLIGRSLTLVDAGDYNADGKSEVLFWYTAYNEDGYSLFYEDFTKRADFWWTYH